MRARRAVAVALALLAGCASSGSDGRSASTSSVVRATTVPSTTPAPSPGCRAEPTLRIGPQEITVPSGGLDRVSDAYLPKGYEDTTPAPVIVDFHAFAPRSIEEGFSGLTVARPDGTVPADGAGAIVLTPLGIAAATTPAWNTTRVPGWADDERFAVDLLDAIEARACVDTRRVYLTGFAIGAQMAAVVACAHADRITAFAAVAGLFDPKGCAPSRAVPVLAFHGTADPMIPYTGGIGPNVPKLGLDEATTAGEAGMVARLAPIPEVLARWARRDGCAGKGETDQQTLTVTRFHWGECADGASVTLYRISGGGHAWPQSPGTKALADLLGPTPDAPPATDVMLAFFATYRLLPP